MRNYTIGIDEAGRGPLAGPVAVGVVMVPKDFDWGLLPGVNDSKKLSEKKREEIFEAAKKLPASLRLQYAVSMVSAKQIDKIGIVPAVKLAMDRALKRLEKGAATFKNGATYSPIDWTIDTYKVLLDGGLTAPERFVDQETIIKGDGKEKVIGLASIVAKVTRDRYMRRRATLAAFAPYTLDVHKGYGTKAHREAIKTHGLSSEHRKSFCRNLL